jgi:predicted metal-dependent peptidase
MSKQVKNKQTKEELARANILDAYFKLERHPLFQPLSERVYYDDCDGVHFPAGGWAVVFQNGVIRWNESLLAEPEEWLYVFAHGLLHLGFGHFHLPEEIRASGGNPRAMNNWQAACDVFVTRFLADLKLGKPPEQYRYLPALPVQSELALYERFCNEGIPQELRGLSIAGTDRPDMIFGVRDDRYKIGPHRLEIDWSRLLGVGLARAARSAISIAGGAQTSLSDRDERSLAQQARTWFINHYPLLGSLAATFKIIEDPALCARMQISVAAVDDELREIYLNPAAALDEQEMRFVMAHEMLHAGLGHRSRQQGRDDYLWNVACDYVINGWLVEMGLGALPQFGGLYDPQLKGLSAESIYDRIVNDLRRYRKLATLRGFGLGDMLAPHSAHRDVNGMDLDEFYRRCLAQGLVYHQSCGRGDLPAGLVEEIQALGQPPIPWDVALARWFEEHFPAQEKVRTFARPSRRQSATPDIPRPSYVPPPGDPARTFGVILDTSGSMDRSLLAKALGAIGSYSLSREVPYVRVVFCDAAPYDQGYLAPEDIAGRVQVKGRGGTVLQPAIDLLERAEDFPKDGPLLIISDGWCDRLHIRREHAFLLPEGSALPFAPQGEVFRVTK